ncbi:polyphosphate polymerase domain-containing protein [Paenibacillus septentrionalis]|uniref:Polyphosphate polymerase domain-containing protein n=1 Tax=Paenibacillus septentrionalis TaxID=429342 RepID=A0ABW1UZC0_9BACL
MNESLKYRNEFKYYISPHQYVLMTQKLKGILQLDQHASEVGEYHIRSLYFDDAANTALHEKLAGVRDRVKYRIRIYNKLDDVIHFEKKIKFRDYIAKVKEPITREMFDQIVKGNIEVLKQGNKPLLLEIYNQMKHKLLRPVVIVDYVREPYVHRYGNVRITFDKYLRTGLTQTNIFDPDLKTIAALDDDKIILEIKYDEYLPSVIQAALQLEGLHRISASKYVICRKYNKCNNWEDY